MSETYNRTFIASSENFSGFKVQIDIRRIYTLQDIVDIFLRELTSILKIHNFEILMDKLKYGNSWHIHTHTLEQILISKPTDVFYVCNHCQ